jgi:hypothetical protein
MSLFHLSYTSSYYNNEVNKGPVIVAARPKARAVFDRSNSSVVGSNPIRSLDVYLIYSVLSCVVSGREIGPNPLQRRPTNCLCDSRSMSYGIWGGRSTTGVCFLRVLPIPPANRSTDWSTRIVIRVWYNRPKSGRRTTARNWKRAVCFILSD